MSRIGIALSVYDKIDELETGIRIIREHWSTKDVFISVCCNDPGSFDRVTNLKIDAKVLSKANFSEHPKTNIRSRQFDSIRKSVGANLGMYVVHYHADAYAVKGEEIASLVDGMEAKEKLIGFRGRGLEYSNAKAIHGDIDDHFVIFNRQAIEERNFFEVDFPQMLTQCNTEALLAFQMKKLFKRDEVWHYSTMAECEVQEGLRDNETFYADGILHRAMNPFNIDPGRGFVHCATRDLAMKNLLEQGVPGELLELLKERADEKHVDPTWLNEWMDE